MLHPRLVSTVKFDVQSQSYASYDTLTSSRTQLFALSGAYSLDLGMQVSSVQTGAVCSRTCVYTKQHCLRNIQASPTGSVVMLVVICGHMPQDWSDSKVSLLMQCSQSQQ